MALTTSDCVPFRLAVAIGLVYFAAGGLSCSNQLGVPDLPGPFNVHTAVLQPAQHVDAIGCDLAGVRWATELAEGNQLYIKGWLANRVTRRLGKQPAYITSRRR